MLDPDPVRFAISSRRHLARAMRSIATGLESGELPLSSKASDLLFAALKEVLQPPPPPPADATTPAAATTAE